MRRSVGGTTASPPLCLDMGDSGVVESGYSAGHVCGEGIFREPRAVKGMGGSVGCTSRTPPLYCTVLWRG